MRNFRKLPEPASNANGDIVGTLGGDGSGVMVIVEPGGAIMVPVNPQYQVDEFGQTADQHKVIRRQAATAKLYKAGHP